MEIPHVSPNSFVRLSTYEWALRTAGYLSASVCSFVLLHTTSVLKKKFLFPEGELELPYDTVYLDPKPGAEVPAKAYREKREPGWLRKWFYLKTGTDSILRSMGREPAPIQMPVVPMDQRIRHQLKAVAALSRRFSMHDLAEEFVAAGI